MTTPYRNLGSTFLNKHKKMDIRFRHEHDTNTQSATAVTMSSQRMSNQLHISRIVRTIKTTNNKQEILAK